MPSNEFYQPISIFSRGDVSLLFTARHAIRWFVSVAKQQISEILDL